MIASAAFLGVLPDGEERSITVEIGLPYRALTEEWRCPIAIWGLHDRLADIAGGDALQALTLALCLAGRLLAHFEAEGGKLLDPQTRTAVSLQSYFPRSSYRYVSAGKVVRVIIGQFAATGMGNEAGKLIYGLKGTTEGNKCHDGNIKIG